jgi:ABC-type nitrate/sulfonate/bicarbonate transport system substrate-binding protein
LTIRAVITGKDAPYQSIADLKGTTFGISRLGSGSQVMASVLGMNEGWTGDDLPKFKGMFQLISV